MRTASWPSDPSGAGEPARVLDYTSAMAYPNPSRRRLSGAAPIATLLLACLALPGSASEKPNSFGDGTGVPKYSVYTYRQADGVRVFTDRAPDGQPFQVMEFSCFACDPGSRVDWGATRLFTTEYEAPIALAAREHGVDEALIRAVIHAESGFNPYARSRKGAMGLMQLMPGTASDMGVTDPWTAQQNIAGGVKYLAMLLSEYKGDITLATAAYNAGPATVGRYRGVPPIAETQTYVRRVRQLLDRYRNAG